MNMRGGFSRFSINLMISLGLLALLSMAFVLHVQFETQVDRAYELRLQSYLLADELRQSGDDLTSMARTYVTTGDPVYKQRFKSVLDIRDGKEPRPEEYSRPYWDLMLDDMPAPRGNGPAIPLLELMRRAGFSDAEFDKLAESKANSDELTIPELAAFELVETTGPGAATDRARAIELMYDANYQQAKVAVMRPIHDFFVLVDERTAAAVHTASMRDRIVRYLFAACGIGLLLALWRTYAALRETLGGSLDEIYAHIARLGAGDLVTEMRPKAGLKNSVLAWLSETQIRLRDTDRDRRREEERFRLVVEAAPNAIVVANAAGTITLVNAQTEKSFGYARTELVGQPIEILVPERLQESHSARRREFAAAPEARTMGLGRELLGRRKDGSEFPVEIGLSPMDTRDGIAILAAIVDATERKQAKDTLQRLNASLKQRVAERTAELEASNKELEAFSYSVSHDLRAPLRAMDGFSELLVRKFGAGLDPEAQGYLQRIRTNAAQMGRLIDDLLELSRLGRYALGHQAIDSAVLVDDCLASLSVVHAGRKVQTVIGDLPHCHGDPVLLKQVWMNLLDNAMKFTTQTDGARIEIGGHVESGECVYHVRDNGVGFDMRYADKLFKVFQRLHSAAEFPGTGIGLAIVERIVKRHGGRVWAESEPGAGATFHFAIRGAHADV